MFAESLFYEDSLCYRKSSLTSLHPLSFQEKVILNGWINVENFRVMWFICEASWNFVQCIRFNHQQCYSGSGHIGKVKISIENDKKGRRFQADTSSSGSWDKRLVSHYPAKGLFHWFEMSNQNLVQWTKVMRFFIKNVSSISNSWILLKSVEILLSKFPKNVTLVIEYPGIRCYWVKLYNNYFE